MSLSDPCQHFICEQNGVRTAQKGSFPQEGVLRSPIRLRQVFQHKIQRVLGAILQNKYRKRGHSYYKTWNVISKILNTTLI